MARVPAPRQIITREKVEALMDPGSTEALTARPGDPATRRKRCMGDRGVASPAVELLISPVTWLAYAKFIQNKATLTSGELGIGLAVLP